MIYTVWTSDKQFAEKEGFCQSEPNLFYKELSADDKDLKWTGDSKTIMPSFKDKC